MKIAACIFLIIISIASALAQPINLNQPLTPDVLKQWDAYIKKNAPSKDALKVVVEIASRYLLTGRGADGMDTYKKYKKYFPAEKSFFDSQIEYYEQQMLMQAPISENLNIYLEYINENAPNEKAFLALKKIVEPFINRRLWDSAANLYRKYKPIFPQKEAFIDKTISILLAPEEGLIVHNLGPKINTEQNEWDPNPTPDGKYLYFSTSYRNDGYGMSDVYYSKMIDGEWQPAQNAGNGINGPQEETVDNVTADGTGLFLSGTFKKTLGMFDIYFIEKKENGWGPLVHFPPPVNTQWTDEGASPTSDGKAIIFTSDRPGGVGKFIQYGTIDHGSSNGNMDIYVSIRTDSGWSEPINLGNIINTPYSERSPFLHPDGKTLYFSSEGHPGLGGLDLFKSVRLKDDSWTEWSEPVNLGKEINSISDDWGYKISVSGDSAFFAGYNRTDGYGGWDIYSITLPKKARPDIVAKVWGKVIDRSGERLAADIIWEDLTSGKSLGQLKSNPDDGSYIILLPLGKFYGFYAQKDGYYPASEYIDLRNIDSDTTLNVDIVLVSAEEMKRYNAKIRVNNIFFDFDKHILKKESLPELNRLVKFLKENPNNKVEIAGHTDSIGTVKYNKDLALRRVNSVVDFLVSNGFKRDRFVLKSFGSEMPIADNKTPRGRALNRRVEIRFLNE